MSFHRNIESIACAEFSFSNDTWSITQAERLNQLLADQHHSSEYATAVCVSAGTFPHTIGKLGVSRLAFLDKSAETLSTLRMRMEVLRKARDWEDYRARLLGKLPEHLHHQHRRELINIQDTGLIGDFATARAAALTTEFTNIRGDIIDTIPQLAAKLREEDHRVTFANFTNVGKWLRSPEGEPYRSGPALLAELAAELPFSDDAVIVDSGDLRAAVHTHQEFFERWQ